MNLEQLQKKLIAAARACPPSDRVPYAFEHRIMAHLKATPLDSWALWSRALWRAAAPCAALMLALGAWSWASSASSSPTGDIAQDMENTLLAAVDQDQPSDTTW